MGNCLVKFARTLPLVRNASRVYRLPMKCPCTLENSPITIFLQNFLFLICRFTTYNALSSSIWLEEMVPSKLLRNAVIGCISSIVSDTAVNVFRVIKTTKQSLGAKHNLSYGDTIRMIVASDGVKGLFGRGLQTRIFANALQSILFTVIWRGLAERWGGGKNAKSGSTSTSSTRTTKKTAAGDTTGDVDDDHHPPPHQVHLRK